MFRWAWLWLAIAHFFLAIGFISATPYLTPGVGAGNDIGAPDERAHVKFVDWLLTKGRLPTLRASDRENYEAHQPPLAYLAMAASCKVAGVAPMTQAAKFPIRLPSALFGALTVVAVFFFARGLRLSEPVAALAASVAAFLPMQIALSGAASNDPLLITCCSWALVCLTKIIAEPDEILAFAGLSILTGAAILTKSTGLALLPTIACLVFLPEVRKYSASVWLALAGAVLIGCFFFLRNHALYGDPLGMNVFQSVWKPDVDREALLTPRGALRWLYVLFFGTVESALGIFGYMSVHYPTAAWSLPVLILLALYLFGMTKILPDSKNRPFLMFWVLVVGLFVLFNLNYVQPQARYVFPTLALGAVFVAVASDRMVGRFAWLVPTVLLGFSLWALTFLPSQFAKLATP